MSKIFLIIVVLCTMPFHFVMAANFGTQVGEFNGVIAYSNGATSYDSGQLNYVDGVYTGIKWQCVEFVQRYYYEKYGLIIKPYFGHANSFYNQANAAAAGLQIFSNGGSESPQVGDILCSNGPSSSYGHVAIVREVNVNYIKVIQQNWFNDAGDNSLTLNRNGNTISGFNSSYQINGWLRNPSSTPSCNFNVTVSGSTSQPLSQGWKFWQVSNANYYQVSGSITNLPSGWGYSIYLANENGGALTPIITGQTSGNFSFSFQVPSSYNDGGKYTFTFVPNGSPGTPWQVSPYFYLSQLPSLNLSSNVPNMCTGDSYTISWIVSGGIPSLPYGGWVGNIQLQWYQNEIAKSTIAFPPISNNSLTITVPSSITGATIPGNSFQISGSNPSNTSIPEGYISNFTNEFEINAPPLQPGSISGNTSVIAGNTYTYSISAVTGASSYSWSFNGGGTPNGTGSSITLTPTSSGTLSVIANNSCGSSSSRSISISVIQSYLISTSSNPSSGGTTIGGGSYQNGQSCTVTANPSSGYTFDNWTEGGSIVSNNASYTFTVSGNRNLVANFTQNPVNYTITTSANPSSGGTTIGSGSYLNGQSCTVTANPSSGYTFDNWTEGGSIVSNNASYTFTISGNRNLVANFTQNPVNYTITTSANPSSGGTTIGSGSYLNGQSCTVTANPSSGYTFDNWTEGGSVVSNSAIFTFNVEGNRSLVANFSNNQNTSISGKLFNDLNTNGIFDPGADALLTAINDWVVHIDGPITSSVTPNSDGSYQFSDLPAGDYSLHLSVPVHWTVINPFFDGVHHISTLGKQNFENIDFACFYLQRDNSEMEVIHFPNGQRTGDNSLLPLHPDAPNQSSPIDSEQLPAHSIHLQVSATGFDPDTIFVYKDYIAQLALSSTDNYTHVIMFDDEALSSIAIGVSPQETRMMTFKTYNVVEGQFYDFHCDVPGHAGRGEVGTMYILGGLNTLPIVQTNNPVAITASGALVGGNVLFSESNPVIERGVYWSTTPNPETTGSVLQAGSGLGEFAVALTGLTSQTTYYVKAFATNANGTAYGEERQFETLEETNCTPGWSPTPNLQYNMQVVAQLLIDGQISLNPNDVVGAFVGEECRGMASPSPDFEGLVFLTVSSNVASGEQVQLKIWNSNDCSACDAIPGFAFENQSELGNYLEPYQVRCGAIQEVAFGQGFTWFSLNVNPGSMTPTSLFADLTPCYDDRVIGQTSFALFTGTNWIGSLTQLGVEKSYRMKLCSAQDISLMGEAAALNPVSLAAGYTWLGYQPQQCQSVNAAMAGLSPGPSYDDRVIGQSSFALFTGSQWIGSLTQMCPGAGYVIKLANAQTLTYPAATSKDSPVVNETLISPTGIYPAEHQQHSMMVVGKLMLEDGTVSINEKDMIYASIDGEIRGMAQPMADNDGLIFLSIGSDEEVAQPISFMLWLDERQELLPLNETLSFEPLAAIGELNNPFIFTLGEMVGLGETTNGIWIGEAYPNPFTERTTIPYFLNEAAVLKFSIYDSRGLLVKAAQTVAADKGHHQYSIESVGLAKGVYMLEVQISGKSLVHNKIIRLVIN